MKTTRLEALKEILPNLQVDEHGIPLRCVGEYDKERDTRLYDCPWVCEDCKKRFWEEKIEFPAREPNDSEKIFAALNELSSKVEQLEALIKINYPINVTGTPSNKIPEASITLLKTKYPNENVLGEVVSPKEDTTMPDTKYIIVHVLPEGQELTIDVNKICSICPASVCSQSGASCIIEFVTGRMVYVREHYEDVRKMIRAYENG